MLDPIRISEFGFKGLLQVLWRKKWLIFWSSVPVLLFAALAGFYVYDGCLGPANKQEAKIQMGNLKSALDAYYTRTDPNRYPMYLDHLVHRNIMQEVPLDPWGEPYIYDLESRTEYSLFSKGPDKKVGTKDDIYLGM